MKVNKKSLVCAMLDANVTTNKALSEASGVSIARISFIKNGHNTTYETACKIANALDVSVNDLIEHEEQAAKV